MTPDMTPESQRIAIAEACGLCVVQCPFVPSKVKPDENTVFTKDAAQQWRLTYPNGVAIKWLPDYLNDQNAMHEAEKVLIAGDQTYKIGVEIAPSIIYGNHLIRLTNNTNPFHATAAQRAEAFLRTLGRWVEKSA